MVLEHREYDPVKAHQYYIENRKLKGTQTQKLRDENRRGVQPKISSPNQSLRDENRARPKLQPTKSSPNQSMRDENRARPKLEPKTLTKAKKENTSAIDKGKSWLKKTLGDIVSSKGPEGIKIGNLVTIKKEVPKMVPKQSIKKPSYLELKKEIREKYKSNPKALAKVDKAISEIDKETATHKKLVEAINRGIEERRISNKQAEDKQAKAEANLKREVDKFNNNPIVKGFDKIWPDKIENPFKTVTISRELTKLKGDPQTYVMEKRSDKSAPTFSKALTLQDLKNERDAQKNGKSFFEKIFKNHFSKDTTSASARDTKRSEDTYSRLDKQKTYTQAWSSKQAWELSKYDRQYAKDRAKIKNARNAAEAKRLKNIAEDPISKFFRNIFDPGYAEKSDKRRAALGDNTKRK